MKTCPNCQEILGDSVNDCFNCRYSFIYERVLQQDEIRKKRLEEEKRQSIKSETEEAERIRLEELNSRARNLRDNLKNKRNLTTGYSFDGYKISAYLGVISGETVLGTGFISEYKAALADSFGSTTTAFSDKLKKARNIAIEQIINSCIDVGGNAIIGINFDYITFTNNLIGVVVNGTAVIIEKE